MWALASMMCGTRPATSIRRWRGCAILAGLLVSRRTRPIELAQHRRRCPEVALVVPEAEVVVGVDRVEAAVLQRVGAQLVREPDAAAALLREVGGRRHPRAPSGGWRLGLVAAVAAQRPRKSPVSIPVQARRCRVLLGLADQDRELLRPPSAGRTPRSASSASASGTRASLTGFSVDADSRR